ncbi:hypothetical protein ACTFIW_008713 [Dictyostelium discoideum]
MNALYLDWSQWKQCLAFPPPILLPSIPKKINSSSSKKVSIILIFLIWRSATWYPMIQAQVPRHHRHMLDSIEIYANRVDENDCGRVSNAEHIIAEERSFCRSSLIQESARSEYTKREKVNFYSCGH